MLFNSLQFLLFFLIITISYWYLPNRYRWFLLLMASCYFYMAFVPRYILILGFTIVIDYFAGIYLEKISGNRARKIFLVASLIANIGVLAIFKYYNFFNDNIDRLLGQFQYATPFPDLAILLPIGLSFHTFQAMSYTIEVYRGKQKAEHHFGIYALYVMFYPQLVAGPIERPQNVLWQFHRNHVYDFEDMKAGLMQMAFGFFKKVVIADRLGAYVDPVYAQPENYSGLSLLIATIFYAFQIYCDFSGYSDIGIGAARTMGYKLMDNFNVPYLSRSISEFWSRWHISLSSWFRDYLYIPLGGNRVPVPRWYFNLFIVFLISGLWHGANWTFVCWGALHGIYLIVATLKDSFLKRNGLTLPQNWITHFIQVLSTFALVTVAWVFFRAPDMRTAFLILRKIGTTLLTDRVFTATSVNEIVFSFMLIALLFLKERYALKLDTSKNLRFYGMFVVVIISCYLFGVFTNNQFIYFQF
jgi:alginate O-acetyltransferase complex protein AlgI